MTAIISSRVGTPVDSIPGAPASGGAASRVERLARFVTSPRWEGISDQARQQLKLRILDAFGCPLGALGAEVPALVGAQVRELGGSPLATLIGSVKSAPDRAALYNGTLVRYLDFNDSYLAPGETCHPSDSLPAVLAACEYSQADGRRGLWGTMSLWGRVVTYPGE